MPGQQITADVVVTDDSLWLEHIVVLEKTTPAADTVKKTDLPGVFVYGELVPAEAREAKRSP